MEPVCVCNLVCTCEGICTCKRACLCAFARSILSLTQCCDCDSSIVKWMAEHGHIGVVKLLLEESDVNPGADYNYAIKWASANGHSEVVKILLKDPRVDPGADNNYAIGLASERGHFEVVKLLLKSLKHKFSVVNYIEILIETPKKTCKEILPEIKELLISHIMKYQWIMNNLLIQHLTIDLLSQINHFIAAN